MLLTKVITYPHLLLGKEKTGETNFVPSTGSHTSLYIIYSFSGFPSSHILSACLRLFSSTSFGINLIVNATSIGNKITSYKLQINFVNFLPYKKRESYLS